MRDSLSCFQFIRFNSVTADFNEENVEDKNIRTENKNQSHNHNSCACAILQIKKIKNQLTSACVVV